MTFSAQTFDDHASVAPANVGRVLRHPQYRPSSVDERVLPHNLEAELGTLGAVLLDNDAFEVAAEVVDSNDFFRDAHRRIFDKMGKLAERNDVIDLVTLREELGRAGDLDAVGGPAYLSALISGVPRSTNVEHYARIIKEKATLRNLIFSANKILATAYEGDGNAADIIEDATRGIVRLAQDDAISSRPALTVLSERELSSIGTLPWLINGLMPAGITVLVAGAGVGKTTLVNSLAVSRASARPWLDRAVATMGPILFVLGEGAHHADARVRAAKVAAGFDADTEMGISVVPHAVNFFEAGREYHALRSFVKEFQPVVVVDTLGLCSVGADENSAGDITRVFANLRRLEAPAVIVTHHLGAAGARERGSSAIRANADALLTLIDVDDVLVLGCEKIRDGAAFEPLRLKLFEVPGTGACSVRLAHQTAASTTLSPAQRQALEALTAAFPTGGDGASRKEWQTLLPTMKERTAYHAFARLNTLGYVTERRGRFVPTGRIA